MARKPRIEFEGAFYHIITRGNQRQDIFKCDEDYLAYSSFLSAYKNKYNFFLYAYALMNNHVHLLIERQKVPISKIMQGINQRYTMYFNKKYGTVGHLFQGRYKAILCDRDEYLLSLVKYIHFNPVRAAIVVTPDEYRWSSHQSYSRTANVTIVDSDTVLRMFSEQKSAARRLYRKYMQDKVIVKREDIYSTIEQRVLGAERFLEHVRKKGREDVRMKRREREFPLEQISAAIERIYGIPLQDIRTAAKSRSLTEAKQLLCIIAWEYGHKGREISSFLRKDPALVTRYCKQKEALKKEAERVERELKSQ